MSILISNVLIEALIDEYKACAMYQGVIDKFGEIRPFCNIVKSEKRHISALLPLFAKYGVPIPNDDWRQVVEVPQTVLEACQLALKAEIENGEMYDRLLELVAEYADIQDVLTRLQQASQENHLPAFQRCVNRECNR